MSSNKDIRITSNQTGVDQEEKKRNTLVYEDADEYGYIILSKKVIFARNLSAAAKNLYAILKCYAFQKNHSFPGYETLCKDMQLKRDMVRRYMQELEQANLIEQRRRGLGLTNIYVLKSIKSATLDVPLEHLPRYEIEADDEDSRHQDNEDSRHTDAEQNRHKEVIIEEAKGKEVKDISKGKALKTKKGTGDTTKKTYSHREHGTIRNETNRTSKIEPERPGRAQPQSMSHIMQGRMALLQTEASPPVEKKAAPARTKTTPQGRSHAAPIFIQAMIADWFSPELHDQAINSSITRAHNLYISYATAIQEIAPGQFTNEQIEEEFRELMQQARAKAKRANIKTLTDKGYPNRMPFFFACLEKSLWQTDDQKTNGASN